MKVPNLKVCFVSAAALALSASQGFAQTSGRVSVKVPFEFTAGNTMLPAGTYDFSEDSRGVLYINCPEHHKGLVVLTNPEPGGFGTETTSVRFDKVNGQYSLTQINLLGEPAHRVIRVDEKSGAFSTRLGLTNATAKSLR